MDVCEMNDDIDKVIIGAGIGTVGATEKTAVCRLR